MQRFDEQFAPAADQAEMIANMRDHLGRRLREYYPDLLRDDAGSPLASMLLRLTEVLDAAEAQAQAQAPMPVGFKDELMAQVPRLRRYALSLTQYNDEDADDLVQFALLKAWEHWRQFRPGTSLIAWLFTILRNCFINGKRKYRLEVPDPDGAFAAVLSGSAEQEHKLALSDLQAALDRLDPLPREALILVAVEGLTYEAAAEIVGCPPGTVKSRVSRARDRLAKEMGES